MKNVPSVLFKIINFLLGFFKDISVFIHVKCTLIERKEGLNCSLNRKLETLNSYPEDVL